MIFYECFIILSRNNQKLNNVHIFWMSQSSNQTGDQVQSRLLLHKFTAAFIVLMIDALYWWMVYLLLFRLISQVTHLQTAPLSSIYFLIKEVDHKSNIGNFPERKREWVHPKT